MEESSGMNDMNLEKFNMGAGYYARLNALLTSAAQHFYDGKAKEWYSVLILIYKEVLAKCKKEDKELIKKEFDDVVFEVNNKEGDPSKIDDKLLFNFELKLRELIEKYNMSTPKSDDPSRAVLRH